MVLNNPLYVARNSRSGAYQIEQSLRFDGSSYMTRTPSSAGNRTTWTLSFWHKRSELGTGTLAGYQTVLAAKSGSGDDTVRFDTSNRFKWFLNDTGDGNLDTSALHRDISAWAHYVVVADYSNSTANDRNRMYINGVQVTDFTSRTNAPLNFSGGINNTVEQVVGRRWTGSTYYLKGYLAEVHLIDGTAVTDATDFGEYDDNGVWRPIAYSGSYGTNGFYLKFDSSATNGIGHDHSGNGNNFTPYSFTTSGSGTDVMSDTPTNNYATMNPLAVRPSYVPTFSEGNLNVTHRSATGQYSHCGSTFAFQSDDSDGFYCEVQNGAQSYGGVALIVADYGVHQLHPDVSNGFSTNANGGIGYDSNGYIRNFGTTIDYTSSYSYNGGSDILGVAVKDNKVWFSINGSWIASGNPSTGANPVITLSSTQTFVVGSYGQGSRTFINNFGQRAFSYTVPTGFKAMNTSNLPAPVIADGSKYFQTVIYTGNGSTQDITVEDNTGNTWQPDLVYIKGRNADRYPSIFDAIRGAGYRLFTNTTDGDNYSSTSLTSFNSDGFSLGSLATYNYSGDSYVAWNWLAGNGTSSNTDGSITSTVSVNATAGFSIVSYTGNNTSGATVGHGLGVAPDFIIIKNRDNSAANFTVYHSGNTSSPETQRLKLNATSTTATVGYWNNTAPSSTVFTLASGSGVNETQNLIAYCFAEVEGYSKIGSYEGNGNADGPFVYCGFRPAWVIMKAADNAGKWTIQDTTRNPYNQQNNVLAAEDSRSESSLASSGVTGYIDALSNGFKIRDSWSDYNTNGSTNIFVAFASNPFGGDGVSPVTAR